MIKIKTNNPVNLKHTYSKSIKNIIKHTEEFLFQPVNLNELNCGQTSNVSIGTLQYISKKKNKTQR